MTRDPILARMTHVGLVTAMLVATGHVTVERAPYDRPKGTVYEHLWLQATDLDDLRKDIFAGGLRLQRDVGDTLERLARRGYVDESAFNSSTAIVLQQRCAQLKTLELAFGRLFSDLFGIRYLDAVAAVHAQSELVESPEYDTDWISHAAGVLALARAMRKQDDDLKADHAVAGRAAKRPARSIKLQHGKDKNQP